MTGILSFGKLSDMMPRVLSALVFAAACGVTYAADANIGGATVRQTSATVILHEGVVKTRPGEVPLDPKLCHAGTFGQIHIVNDRIHICRKRG